MESQILLILGLAFVAALGFILKQSNSVDIKETKDRASRKAAKPVKPKRSSQKKGQKKGAEVSEWVGVDTAAKDAQDMLEFLKGRDPKEISKHLKAQNPVKKAKAPVQPPVQQSKKGKNQQKQEVQSDDSSSDVVEEGFSLIEKKAPKPKKEKKAKEEKEEKQKFQKAFFKDEEEARQAERKAKQEERKNRPPGEKKERKPREPKAEKSEGEEDSSANEESPKKSNRPPRERRERPEGEQKERPVRAIVAPNVPKYEAADINDILNNITKDFKKKPQREVTLFSKIPREIVTEKILIHLNAKDLVSLERVNKYFRSTAKKDSLWKNLYVKEFGSNVVGITSFKRQYQARKTGKEIVENKPKE